MEWSEAERNQLHDYKGAALLWLRIDKNILDTAAKFAIRVHLPMHQINHAQMHDLSDAIIFLAERLGFWGKNFYCFT